MKSIATICILIIFGYSTSFALKVETVIDGDTLILDNGEKVRMIGVDTPETLHPTKPVQYFAKEAKEFTRRMVEGKEVRLEYDWQKRDKYDRLLAYIYLSNGTFVNAEIIKNGYGFAYIKYPFKYQDEFLKYEKEARENQKGLWEMGGEKEYQWTVKSSNIKKYVIVPMNNNLWGIEYAGFHKIGVKDADLIKILYETKYLANELSDKDLRKELLNKGWQKDGGEMR